MQLQTRSVTTQARSSPRRPPLILGKHSSTVSAAIRWVSGKQGTKLSALNTQLLPSSLEKSEQRMRHRRVPEGSGAACVQTTCVLSPGSTPTGGARPPGLGPEHWAPACVQMGLKHFAHRNYRASDWHPWAQHPYSLHKMLIVCYTRFRAFFFFLNNGNTIVAIQTCLPHPIHLFTPRGSHCPAYPFRPNLTAYKPWNPSISAGCTFHRSRPDQRFLFCFVLLATINCSKVLWGWIPLWILMEF